MKTLTAAALAAVESATPQPALLLKLVAGDPPTAYYYADRALSLEGGSITAEARVLDWGDVESPDRDGRPAPGPSAALRLADPDGALAALCESPGLLGAEATVCLHCLGLGESDLVPLATGRVRQGPIRREEDGSVELVLDDLSQVFADRLLGRAATREDFPTIREEDAGRILPLVYGRPRRVEAVGVALGARSELARAASAGETTLIVEDASRFPAGEISLRIGTELVRGSFSGNSFLVGERGCVLASDTTDTETPGSLFIVRAPGLAMTADNEMAGTVMELTLGGRLQRRLVRYSVASDGLLVLDLPFVGETGDIETVGPGVPFTLRTVPLAHPAGAAVCEARDEYVYVAAGHAIGGVVSVAGLGTVAEEVVDPGGRTLVRERTGLRELPAGYWTADCADAMLAPSLGALAVVRLLRAPSQIAGAGYADDRIWLDLEGPRDAADAVIQTPGVVLAHLLETHGGLPAPAIDAASFATADSARAERIFSFALERRERLSVLAADLARQACLALSWEDGRVRARVLSNVLGSPALTLDAAAMHAGGLVRSCVPPEEAFGSVRARYRRPQGAGELRLAWDDAEGETAGRELELDLWAYEGRHHARAVAAWWLRRLRHRYERLTLDATLEGAALERGDIVELDRSDAFPAAQRGVVEAVEVRPDRFEAGEAGRVRLHLRLPRWAGCTASCEHACEAGACESGSCETGCTIGVEVGCAFSCETSCEEACELSCTADCELACMSACMVVLRSPGSVCGSACESGCETACEGFACESSCESGCEASCESAGMESVLPVRQVRVLSAPTSAYGAAQVRQVDRSGNLYGEAFTAWDAFDLHPGAGEEATVYLNFNLQWVLIPGERPVKYVRVLASDSSGAWQVREQDRDGTAWGSSFLAWAVDSV